MEKTVRIFAKERFTGDGKKFLVFSFISGCKYYEVKFTKNCVSRPTTSGYWLVTILDANLSERKVGDRKFPVLWVKSCKDVKVDEEYTKQKEQERIEELENVLDGLDSLF